MTYSSSLSMTRQQRFGQRNQNTTSLRSEKKGIGPISNSIILIILACILGLLYLAQITKTNAYGYKINALNEKHSQLRQEHSELEVASARLQALDRVQNSEVAKSLTPVAPSGTIAN